MSDNLLVDDTDGVRLITFNRPEKLNAFDNALYHAGGDALDDALARDDIKCVVFTGAGRAFSAGQDLAEMAAIDPDDRMSSDLGHGFPRFLDTAAAFEKPLLAAVNGLGIGIGMTLLLHCDLALIADTAELRRAVRSARRRPRSGRQSPHAPDHGEPARVARALHRRVDHARRKQSPRTSR